MSCIQGKIEYLTYATEAIHWILDSDSLELSRMNVTPETRTLQRGLGRYPMLEVLSLKDGEYTRYILGSNGEELESIHSLLEPEELAWLTDAITFMLTFEYFAISAAPEQPDILEWLRYENYSCNVTVSCDPEVTLPGLSFRY